MEIVVWTWAHTTEKSSNKISLLKMHDVTNFAFFQCPCEFNVSKKKKKKTSVSRKAPLVFIDLIISTSLCDNPN